MAEEDIASSGWDGWAWTECESCATPSGTTCGDVLPAKATGSPSLGRVLDVTVGAECGELGIPRRGVLEEEEFP
jgi:hypothetical protein